MTRLAGSGDPVAVWSGPQGNEGVFYVVNRAPFAVTAVLSFGGKPTLKHLASGTATPLAAGKLQLSLPSYQLLAFGGGAPTGLAVTSPPAVRRLLEKQIAFAGELLAEKGAAAEVTLVRCSLIDKQRAAEALQQAQTALQEGRLVTARRRLMQPALVKVYEAFTAYPPDLFYRKSPPVPEPALTPQAMLPKLPGAAAKVAPAARPRSGNGPQAPTLKLAGMIGDVRGRGLDNLSVAVTDDGRIYLLMYSGRVAVFNADGRYLASRQVKPGGPPDNFYLAAQGSRVYLGDWREDCPWALTARRAGSRPGQFQGPRALAADPQGTLFIADTGNRRLQVFKPGETETPSVVVDLSAAPRAVTCRGHELAVLTDDNRLLVFAISDTAPTESLAGDVGPGACAVAIEPGGGLVVAFGSGGGDQLRRYERQEKSLRLAATIAHGAAELWPNYLPAAVPLTTGPDGQVWFATDSPQGALCSLDPRTDVVTERVRGLPRPLAVGFDQAGKAFVTGFPQTSEPARRQLLILTEMKPQAIQPFWQADVPLTTENVPLYGLLPDTDGGVYIRVVEEGYQKGWPALAIKKVYPDGRMLPFLDFGELYARRRTFAPWEMPYALRFDARHNIILAALPLTSVLKATPEGKVLWEAGPEPRGDADQIAFRAPRDVAVDSRGSLWVVDADLNQLLCLSPEGKLLLTHGVPAGVDEREGKGFDAPTGVAVTRVDGHEFLYVADAGNQRLVKFEITYP